MFLLYVGLVTFFSYITLYVLFYKFLMKISDNFRNLEYNRRMYIVKNYVKSFVLGIGTINSLMIIYYILFAWSPDIINFVKFNTLAYFLTDTVGLLLVRKLEITTKMHHMATNLLGMFVVLSNHTNICGANLPALYGAFSTLSFSVNFYLAFRAQHPTSPYRPILSKISFWIYAITSIINWFVQTYYLSMVMYHTNEYIFQAIYSLCLFVIIKDDIVLMKWLRNDFIKRNVIKKVE